MKLKRPEIDGSANVIYADESQNFTVNKCIVVALGNSKPNVHGNDNYIIGNIASVFGDRNVVESLEPCVYVHGNGNHIKGENVRLDGCDAVLYGASLSNFSAPNCSFKMNQLSEWSPEYFRALGFLYPSEQLVETLGLPVRKSEKFSETSRVSETQSIPDSCGQFNLPPIGNIYVSAKTGGTAISQRDTVTSGGRIHVQSSRGGIAISQGNKVSGGGVIRVISNASEQELKEIMDSM